MSEFERLITEIVGKFPPYGAVYRNPDGSMTPACTRLIDEKVLMDGIRQVFEEAARDFPRDGSYQSVLKWLKKWWG